MILHVLPQLVCMSVSSFSFTAALIYSIRVLPVCYPHLRLQQHQPQAQARRVAEPQLPDAGNNPHGLPPKLHQVTWTATS